MRNINPSEIILKKYSIIDNQNSHSIDFYSKEIINYILSNNISINDPSFQILKEKDEKLLEREAIRYCSNKNINILKDVNKTKNLLEEPKKNIEIFNLNIKGGKICISRTNDLIESDSEKELYYNLETAIKIYKNKIDLQEMKSIENDDIYEFYRDEIVLKEDEIKKLIKIDNDKYIDDTNSYEIIKSSPLFYDYQNKLLENNKIKNELEEYNKKIANLSRMLRIALDELEKDKSKVLNKNSNLFRKIMNRLRKS